MSEENGGDAAVAATAAGVADAIRFEIKEFSEGSESATTDEEHPSATGPPQSTSGHSRSVSETQNEGALNATAEEKSSRGNQTPGAKKGGRRVSGHRAMLSWSGLTGIGKSRPEIGDLVEAEWQGSGSWYVGYVEGKASVDGSSRRSKGVYHVVFADGDKADVHGRDLKQLGSSGHAKGSAGTLPRHVPVADLGSGRLHQKPTASAVSPEGKAEPKSGKRRGKSARKKQSKSPSQQGESGSAEEPETTVDSDDQHEQSATKGVGRNGEGREIPPPLRRGSAGNVDDRCNQAEQAVWGGRRAPSKSIVGGGAPDRGGGDWWETGTRYAFQPRLVADKPTVRSLVGHGGGAAGHRVGNGGSGRNGESGLTTQRDSRQSEGGLPLRRVIQPAEGNSARGQRVFFLA